MNFRSAPQMPEKSTLPSAVRGVRADAGADLVVFSASPWPRARSPARLLRGGDGGDGDDRVGETRAHGVHLQCCLFSSLPPGSSTVRLPRLDGRSHRLRRRPASLRPASPARRSPCGGRNGPRRSRSANRPGTGGSCQRSRKSRRERPERLASMAPVVTREAAMSQYRAPCGMTRSAHRRPARPARPWFPD